jgi:hypothetical protein
MKFRVLMFVLGVLAFPANAHAQSQLTDDIKAMEGDWEISNADRDKLCLVSLMPVAAPGGMKLEFDGACAETFSIVKEIVAWRLDKDGLHFVDAKGTVLLHLDEVEKGMFEGIRPGDGRYFVQSMAAVRTEAKPEQVFGEWQVSRGTEDIICVIIFNNTRQGDNYSLELKPGCGNVVANFGPTSWRLDQGEIIINSARGFWRFEEAGEIAWRRVPEGSDPLWLVRPAESPAGSVPAEGGG